MDTTIKGIILDYGGTIDTNGIHWFEVFYKMYNQAGILSDKENLRKAYVYAEREMEHNSHLIKPQDTFKDNLHQKVEYQMNYLQQNGIVESVNENKKDLIVEYCYDFARKNIYKQSHTLSKLSEQYPLILVSNFYGNLQSVLKDFQIEQYFQNIIESSHVVIRKPDPEIFWIGIKALDLPAHEVAVIGDSYKNDIVPSQKLGCTTVWLKGQGWNDDEDEHLQNADYTINTLEETLTLFN